MSRLTQGMDIHKRVKVWNEDRYNKENRLDYWGRFDKYFRCEIHKTDAYRSDSWSLYDYLNDNYTY